MITTLMVVEQVEEMGLDWFRYRRPVKVCKIRKSVLDQYNREFDFPDVKSTNPWISNDPTYVTQIRKIAKTLVKVFRKQQRSVEPPDGSNSLRVQAILFEKQ
ncbi:hypothetical protein L6452_15070 [Arctium lappa]|uniref:Uncharacterized protein n=1 Tax=Arctium lappa TaxID=4217 RepID=A0ACB9CMQ3_ARCLA|nr:hypothetical protein L6452_15070 [Arctium lappa]